MTDKSQVVQGLTLEQWEAAFRPGMPEFSATNFAFSQEAQEQVRIAFSNQGPIINANGERSPVYTHAVTLPPSIAVNLARVLLEHYAKPIDDPSKPAAPV
ncbi:hypothetical protein [Paraburkholderia sediminicola]|jgi:hypothetical protein|uniref:hypothetical protein n=1 Tax=Paraburkholderia sediminicola TaxID=458836 RepID=UPI0038B6B535